MAAGHESVTGGADGADATTPIDDKQFALLFAEGLFAVYVKVIREQNAVAKDAVHQYLAGTISASAMIRQIAALDDLGREKIALEFIILIRRLAPNSAAPAWDADLQWIVWPDAGCAAEWVARYTSDFGRCVDSQ